MPQVLYRFALADKNQEVRRGVVGGNSPVLPLLPLPPPQNPCL